MWYFTSTYSHFCARIILRAQLEMRAVLAGLLENPADRKRFRKKSFSKRKRNLFEKDFEKKIIFEKKKKIFFRFKKEFSKRNSFSKEKEFWKEISFMKDLWRNYSQILKRKEISCWISERNYTRTCDIARIYARYNARERNSRAIFADRKENAHRKEIPETNLNLGKKFKFEKEFPKEN